MITCNGHIISYYVQRLRDLIVILQHIKPSTLLIILSVLQTLEEMKLTGR